MAARTITMLQIRRIIQLLSSGHSKRFIARELELARNTVKDYIKLIHQSSQSYTELLALNDDSLSLFIHDAGQVTSPFDKRWDDFQSTTPAIEQELKKTGVTRLLLWQEYRMVYPDGYGYTQFCHHVSEHIKHKDVVMRFEHKPGEKMLVDFAGKTMNYTDAGGKEIKCQVFIAILPYSGYTYTQAVLSQKQPDFIHCLQNAMKFFGGAPQCIISDNLKSCIKRPDRYEPELTELLNQFSLHYTTTITATRVAKPRDKASVEKAVHLAYQRIYAPLRNQTFHGLEELNAAIRLQTQVHHTRRFRNSEQSRCALFETDEKTLLSPLPESPFQLNNCTMAKVQRNYHIVLGEDWHYYSVPYQYVGKQVKVIYNYSTVAIYCEHQRIALHPRNNRKNCYTTTREHMAPNHQHYAQIKGWDADYFRKRASAFSPEVSQVIESILGSRFFYEQTYNACIGVLRLADKYTPARLTAACTMAIKANAVNYKFVCNILRHNMDLRPAPPIQLVMPLHDNIRGPLAYE
jgi:transposase